jgi:hypothetical protein
MRALKLVSGSLVLLALALTAAQAGTVMVVDTWAYDPYSDSGVYTLYVGENKVRVEIVEKERIVHVLFDLENKDAPVMWMMDPAAQTYTKMDLKTLEKIQSAVQAQMEMLENYTAKMPQEEKAEFTKQYKKNIRQAEDMLKFDERAKKTTYELVAAGEKVKTWTCDHVKGTFNKELYREVWVAPYGDLGVEPGDLAILTALSQVFKAWVGDARPFAGLKVDKSDKPIEGYPVKIVYYEEGNKIVRQELKEIRKEDVDPKLFVLPEGYTEKPAEVQ